VKVGENGQEEWKFTRSTKIRNSEQKGGLVNPVRLHGRNQCKKSI